MALHLILGNAGAGKSHYLFEKIIQESMARPDRQYLILVPEQFTMQTQKDLVMMHPGHGIMNIDVLSFERLAHRVFEEVGGEHRRILEDSGKNLILRRLAEEKRGELHLLGGNIKKLGFIAEVKSLLSEFVQYRIGPEELDDMIAQNQDNPQLCFKLADMKVICESFQEYLKGTYLTAEQLLEALAQVIDRSESVRGSVIALDGYSGFTPIQMSLIGRLLELSEDVYVTFTIDSREDVFAKEAEHELFYKGKKTVHDLVETAEKAHARVEEPVVLGRQKVWRYQNAPALAFLESHIFRHENRFYEEQTDEITLFAARSPQEEAEYIGREIRKLARDEGYRYREIAVVTGDLETYGTLFTRSFATLDIPGFIDRKRDVLKNPFVEALRALLGAVRENFSYEAMFRYLRSGMAPVEAPEADLLENYVLARGVRGLFGWTKSWRYPLKGMTEEELAALNTLREKAADGLEVLTGRLKEKGTNAEKMTRALYDYLLRLDVQQRLKDRENRFEAAGEHDLAREYAQIYGMVMELFDKLVMLLGDCEVTLDEYAELLDAGLTEMKLGLIPAGTDQVVVGDMERSRLKEVKILFFAGVNEGSVPRRKSGGGLLSEMDRERLSGQGVELAPTARQETCIQKLYMYLALTKPSRQLRLSWSLADEDGNALRPSYLIVEVQDLFPEIPVRTEADESLLDQLAVPEGSLGLLAEALQADKEGKAAPEQRALLGWFARQDKWRERLDALLDAVFYTRREEPIARATARALYGKLLSGSVTRLERFAACAYAHFLQYGLRLTEREICGLKAVDMGNVFHDALKYFSEAVEAGGYGWFHVPDEKREEWMAQALKKAVREYTEQGLLADEHDAYTLQRMERIAQRTAWAVLEQLKRGEFLPEETEVAFRNLEHLPSVSVLLSENARMRLRGRIDRLDVCRRDGEVFVRVIDYKSGGTRFDLTSVYYGLQLQLAVYLNAALELESRNGGGKARPAGMFYYHIEDPLLDYLDEEDPARRLLKELAWNGIVNDDREVLLLQDRGAQAGSDVLPVKFKKDGGYTAASSVADEEQLLALSRHASAKLKDYGERILRGEVSLAPYELRQEDACRFCAYHSVCGFDRRLPGCEKRRLEPLEPDEVWEKIQNSFHNTAKEI
ncbi:MAG: helicase-exonuclease AddAB subunit AddB [Lachnospiraceae bacterium]|nr:helicase-exonuclease AddAB subunit AddB [Lachnospiraceae bacterium]